MPRDPALISWIYGRHRILSGSFGGRSVVPRIVAAGEDIQDSAHEANREFGLVRGYESEDFGGTSPVSPANQVVTQEFLLFASISRSCFIWRNFLRRRRSSSRSSVESRLALLPSSRSACFNQLRMVCSVG